MTETAWDHVERKQFSPKQRAQIFAANDGRCHKCKRKLKATDTWIAEHLIALSAGGNNEPGNMCVTCKPCFPIKNAEDAGVSAKIKRTALKHYGNPKTKTRPMPGNRDSKFRKRINGQTVLR